MTSTQQHSGCEPLATSSRHGGRTRAMSLDKINIAQKLSLIHEYWSPRIAGEHNDSYVKLAKLKGEFVWHSHQAEDELLLVLTGKLLIKLRDRNIELGEGE